MEKKSMWKVYYYTGSGSGFEFDEDSIQTALFETKEGAELFFKMCEYFKDEIIAGMVYDYKYEVEIKES